LSDRGSRPANASARFAGHLAARQAVRQEMLLADPVDALGFRIPVPVIDPFALRIDESRTHFAAVRSSDSHLDWIGADAAIHEAGRLGVQDYHASRGLIAL
jgi:hypothetical protein